MALAIFDLDETLISADSDHQWGQFIIDKGLVDALSHKAKNDYFYAEYKQGRLDINAYLAFSCAFLAQHPMPKLIEWRQEFVTTVMEPLILPLGRDLIARHRQAGDTVMVITSTIEFVTAPIVDSLGIEILIAPIPEIKNDRYTGAITGVPSFAAGKVTRLEQWLSTNACDLDGSYFYSDSHNDLPLLRLVDNPVAVDPDDQLLKEAVALNWQVISLRS